jgi:hypothetical protein
MTTYIITFPINYLKGANKKITKAFTSRQAALDFAYAYARKYAFSTIYLQEAV